MKEPHIFHHIICTFRRQQAFWEDSAYSHTKVLTTHIFPEGTSTHVSNYSDSALKKGSSDGILLGLGGHVLAPGAASKAYAALRRLVGSARRTARSSLQTHTAPGQCLPRELRMPAESEWPH